MIAIDPAMVRVVRTTLRDGAALAREVSSPDWVGRADVLKRGERSVVMAGVGVVDGGRSGVVVKSMVLDRAKDRAAIALGRTRLLRQWRGAMLLARGGIATASVLVVARGRDGLGRPVETLVMERIGGPTVIGCQRDGALSARERAVLARRLGGQAAGMALAAPPIFNRDHKGSNIIVARAGDGSPAPVLIDTAGVRRWRGDAPIAMLAKLHIEMVGLASVAPRTARWRALRAFYAAYLEDWGAADARTRRAQVKKGWRAIARMVERHGDPTPKDDPAHP